MAIFTKYKSSWIRKVVIIIPILVLSLFVSNIKINKHLLNPFEVSDVEYDFYDVYFAKFGVPPMPTRSDIFLFNTFGLNRNQVAEIVDSISILSPKVIGIDIFFDGSLDSVGTAKLEKSLSMQKNKIVLGSELERNSIFQDKFTNGFIYFPSQDGFTIRNQYERYNNQYSFANEIYFKYKGEKPDKSIVTSKSGDQRAKVKYINYRYDNLSAANKNPFIANSFIELSKESFSDESIKAMVDGKIVLLGHINKDSTVIIDRHFTPLNKEYIGRSLPDMDGIMIHANTLAMHLDKDYIITMYPIVQWSLTFVLLFLNVTILIRFTKSKFVFKDNVLRLIQIIQTIIMFIFAIVIFHHFRVRIDLSIFLLPILSFVDIGKFMIEKLVPFILKENN